MVKFISDGLFVKVKMSRFGEVLRETRRKGLSEMGSLIEITEWNPDYRFFKEVPIPFHKISEAIPGFSETDILSNEEREALAIFYAPKSSSGWAFHQRGVAGISIDYYNLIR